MTPENIEEQIMFGGRLSGVEADSAAAKFRALLKTIDDVTEDNRTNTMLVAGVYAVAYSVAPPIAAESSVNEDFLLSIDESGLDEGIKTSITDLFSELISIEGVIQ